MNNKMKKLKIQVCNKSKLIKILYTNLVEVEKQSVHHLKQFINSNESVNYLLDLNLALEVEKLDLIKDVVFLESRLVKYQQLCRGNKCTCDSNDKVKKLKHIQEHHEALILFLKRELKECNEELIKVKQMLENGNSSAEQENNSLKSIVEEMEEFAAKLKNQVENTEATIVHEQKVNASQAKQIEELNCIIDKKNLQIVKSNDANKKIKDNFDRLLARNQKLEGLIEELRDELINTEIECVIPDENGTTCRNELSPCMSFLQDVRQKIRSQRELLENQKQECIKLQGNYTNQKNNSEVYKKELEKLKIKHRDEISDLKHTIKDLRERLVLTENNIQMLNKEAKQAQILSAESARTEMKLQQEYSRREQELIQKLHRSQAEEIRLHNVVKQLEKQLDQLTKELLARDQQIEVAKKSITQTKTEGGKQLILAQEEISKMKNEINGMLQKQNILKLENEQLHEQVMCLKNKLHQHDNRYISMKEQLDQCSMDIKTIQEEKMNLEQRNMQLTQDLNELQAVLQRKVNNVNMLGMELMEARTNREQLCTGSQTVVNNVRIWLDEQKRLNQSLKEKLQRKDALIAKYEREQRIFRDSSDCTCCHRQRGGESLHQCSMIFSSPPPTYHSSWSIGSNGSSPESPTSSMSSDWYDYRENSEHSVPDDENHQLWIHRVESMTEDLQRSNRYWKRKIDSEFEVTKNK